METTRKSVYPVHKLEAYDPEFLENQSKQYSDNLDDNPDVHINQHYFNMVLPDKPWKKCGFTKISKPHQVSKHTLPIHQDEYVIRESKIDFLTKLGNSVI